MDLIDRYIHAVGLFLPRKNRGDIQSELRSVLVDTLEDRTGGEPGEEDVVAFLKEFGPPNKVAASYWPEGQYLIGPTLFPAFRTAVGIALLVTVVVHLVLFGVTLLFNQEPQAALKILGEFPGSALSLLGTIVLVFYLLQLYDVRVKSAGKEWDPRQLPAVEAKDLINRGELILGIVLGLVLLALLMIFQDRIGFVITPGTEIIPNPVISRYIYLIAVAVFLGVGINLVALWQGRWQIGTQVARIGSNLFGLYTLAVLIKAHATWLTPRVGNSFLGLFTTYHFDAEFFTNPEFAQILFMQAFQGGLVIALVVTIIETIKLTYQLTKRTLEPASYVTVISTNKSNSTK